MNQAMPEALKRVAVVDDPDQEAAAQIAVDYTGGGDRATLTLNPALVPEDAREGYALRAAIAAALEPFRRYNRHVTRRYGTLEREQALFDAALKKAAFEVEQLIHLTPSGPRPELQPTPQIAEPADAVLPDDFPERGLLLDVGYRTLQAVRDAGDQELLDISGIGQKRLNAIRAALTGSPDPAAE
jgi:hypothetical protein